MQASRTMIKRVHIQILRRKQSHQDGFKQNRPVLEEIWDTCTKSGKETHDDSEDEEDDDSEKPKDA